MGEGSDAEFAWSSGGRDSGDYRPLPTGQQDMRKGDGVTRLNNDNTDQEEES